MQARRIYMPLALVALATIGIVGVAALFFLGDDVETNPGVAYSPAPAPSVREMQSASPDQGLGGRVLHALRSRQASEPAAAPQPPAEPASVVGTAPLEQQASQQQAMAVPDNPDGAGAGYIAYEVEAPLPPRRPTLLDDTAKDYPSPPRRPTQLASGEWEASAVPVPAPSPPPATQASAPTQQAVHAPPPQPLPEPPAPSAQQTSPWFSQFGAATPAPAVQSEEPAAVEAPQPPRRPVRLAALEPPTAALAAAPAVGGSAPTPPVAATPATPETAAPTAAAPALEAAPATRGRGGRNVKTEGKAASAGTQVAALQPQDGLRPAPSESFEQDDQSPKRFNMGAPVFIRIFKKEGELELWMKVKQHYTLYRSFPICKWSGKLGPKLREADYQSPEGFYSVSAKQLNPHSNYHRAFNVGYPNAFDKQNGRTGGLVMVHGNCKSVGCFAMTDKGVEEIYGFVAAALTAGQREVPVHIFPFRMTEAAIERETGAGFLSFLSGENGGQRWKDFWRNLKEGYDRFEATREPPAVFACGDHYSFDANGGCQRIAGW